MNLHRFVLVAVLLLGVGVGPLYAATPRDAETERYQTELQQLRIEGSMFDLQMRAFEQAPQEMRTKMWNDLEILKRELATEEMQELLKIREQNEATPDYDAETLSYKAALESAGKSAEEVNGLVTLYSTSNELLRQALRDNIEGN